MDPAPSISSLSLSSSFVLDDKEEEGSHRPTDRCDEEDPAHDCQNVADTNQQEQAQEKAVNDSSTSSSSRCFCCSKRPRSSVPIFRGNREALAWCLDVLGRTVAVLSIGAFLMPALLQSARIEAGCLDPEQECDNTVHGIKPSSLLTVTHTIVSVCASPLLPLMGAIVDYTPHRRLTGRILSSLFLACMFPMIFVSAQTWFALSILVVFLFLVFEFQMVAAYSYLPELTRDETQLRQFTRNFTTVSFTAVVVYISAVVGITRGALHITDDSAAVARVALSASFGMAFIAFAAAWAFLFHNRLPLHELPPDKSVWTAGFAKLGDSIRKITRQDDYRPLLWFYLAILFGDAALQSLPTILITFFTDQLALDSADIGVAVLLLLLGYIPAGFLSAICTKLFRNNPVYSSILSLIILIAVIFVIAAVLHGPGQTTTVYILVFCLGIGTGWKYTCDRMLSVAIIPQHQSGEFMGLYLFATIVLTWLPPLIFTLLNEAGVSQNIGVALLNVFFLASLVTYGCMGNYRQAMEGTQGVFSQAGASNAAGAPGGGETTVTIEEEEAAVADAPADGRDGGGFGSDPNGTSACAVQLLLKGESNETHDMRVLSSDESASEPQ